MIVLSQSGVAELERVLGAHVADQSIPGVVALIGCEVTTMIVAVGALALDDERPVQRNTIFRIASMTKPITAALLMMLVEDGLLRLDEPIDRPGLGLWSRRDGSGKCGWRSARCLRLGRGIRDILVQRSGPRDDGDPVDSAPFRQSRSATGPQVFSACRRCGGCQAGSGLIARSQPGGRRAVAKVFWFFFSKKNCFLSILPQAVAG